MHRHPEQEQAQQRHHHIEELEDLVNDLLCHSASFVSTTADPPRRRRRQCPKPLETSCTPLYSPLSSPSAVSPLGVVTVPEECGVFKRSIKDGSVACRGPSPTTSPKQGSLRAHSRKRSPSCEHAPSRERAPSRQASSGPSPKHDSLRSHSGRKLSHQRECAECTSRAHAGGKMHHADTREHASSPVRRAKTAGAPLALLARPAQPTVEHIPVEQLQRGRLSRQLAVAPTPAPSRSHLPVPLTRPPSRRNLAALTRAPSRLHNVAAGPRSIHLNEVAHAVIACVRMGTRTHSTELAVLEWEHHARLELKARRRQEMLASAGDDRDCDKNG
ncbi:hypothetical protein T484DRAFT_1928119 [Baffinella frigidus]|nr:hypothetical protein T484DRAFT_1928119 [Cryptophyta sp. CCMP2293]